LLKTAEPEQRRDLAVIDTLDSIPQGLLRHTDIFYQTLEPAWLDRSSLIAAPHRPVKGNMPLNQASP
jgi:hypothetical protein